MKHHDLLALGIFSSRSRLGDRVELLLRRDRTFSPRVSAARVAVTAVALFGSVIASSLAPRLLAFAPQPEARLAFEVASVRQRPAEQFKGRSRLVSATLQCAGPSTCGISGNRFTEEMVNVNILIMDAYNVKEFQIDQKSVPSWATWGGNLYDISAKVEGDRTPAPDAVRRMLQTLLADRFQLRLHRETRTIPMYGMVAAKSGLKLTRLDETRLTEDGRPKVSSAGGGGRGGSNPAGYSMPQLADALSDLMPLLAEQRPAIDRTGLQGVYELRGQNPLLALDMAQVKQDPIGLFYEVENKWGLKLEPQEAPVDILVVDHVEKLSEN